MKQITTPRFLSAAADMAVDSIKSIVSAASAASDL